MDYHRPVLLKESVDGLNIKPNGIYVDVTFGGGGHSREILKRLGKKGTLLGFDQDDDTKHNIPDDKRFLFADNNFRFLRNFLKFYGIDTIDGLLADLGVSSHHFDEAKRGFSFRFDEKLDMRMNQLQQLTAEQVVNRYDADHLTKILADYGEVNNPGRLAREIVKQREGSTISSTGQLREIVGQCYGKHNEMKVLAPVFQALRIEVNQEIRVLEELLEASIDVLKPGGRLVIITYHSLEDRVVKRFMKSGRLDGEIEKDFYGNTSSPLDLITRKAIVPSDEEIEQNPRSRSAKLRIVEKR